MIDHKTAARQYPLPHVQNSGNEDCDRIRSSLSAIDEDMNALIEQSDHLQINKADQTEVDVIQQSLLLKTPIATTEALQAELSNLSALVFANL
nr:hypothetical protein [uncultured Undibacterium sp.]